jgi:hypothetical protein
VPSTTVAPTTTVPLYDPLTAAPDERYDKYVELAEVYGYEVDMRRDESYTLPAGLCSRDVDEMVVHLRAMLMIGNAQDTANSRTGIADSYCPTMRLVLEAGFSEIGAAVTLPAPAT